MKTVTKNPKSPLPIKQREKLATLIDMVIANYPVHDIAEIFLEKIKSYHDRDEVVQAILNDELTKDNISFKLEDEFSAGKFIVALETQEQESKLKDFVCEFIYPYYNQQQTALFA